MFVSGAAWARGAWAPTGSLESATCMAVRATAAPSHMDDRGASTGGPINQCSMSGSEWAGWMVGWLIWLVPIRVNAKFIQSYSRRTAAAY